jgi:hypothetical protein
MLELAETTGCVAANPGTEETIVAVNNPYNQIPAQLYTAGIRE